MSRSGVAETGRFSHAREGIPPTLLALGAAALLALARLGATDVVRMEGIVAEGARTMLAGEGWCVPHVHGAPYAYKPPMAYWLVAGSFSAFGESAWTLRLPFALATVGLAAAVVVFTRALVGTRTAALAGLASTSGVLFLQKARVAEFDALIAAGVGAATVAACVNLAAQRPRAGIWLAAGVGLAFGTLAKGPIALLLYGGGVLGAATALRRTRRLLTPGHLASLGIAAALVGAWSWCAWREGGSDAYRQPLSEASIRALDWSLDAFARTAAKPLLVPVLFFPWSLFALRAAWARLRSSSTDEARSLALAAAAAVAGGVLALCAIPTFEPRYFLPLAAPLGVVAAVAVGAPARPGRRMLAPALALVALTWLVETQVLEPRRAAKRSLRGVALELGQRLPADATVWTVGEDEHSSLFYYLDRPVRAFESLEALPREGAWLVLPERVDTRPGVRADPRLAPVAEARHGDWRYLLARVVAGPESGRLGR